LRYEKEKTMPNPIDVKKKYKLTVAPIPLGPPLPEEVQKLNGGKLHIFGQSGGLVQNTLNILSIDLHSGDGKFQRSAAGVIHDMDVEFIYFPNGDEGGTRYVFRKGQAGENSITNGTITGPSASAADPKNGDVDEDLGTWSGTGGISPKHHKKDHQDHKKDHH
jgi:hypothetical protein